MTSTNPKTIELTLDSGVRVWVTPLNRYQLRGLQDTANERFPLPNPKAFEQPIKGDTIEGLTLSAEENPEYIALKLEAERNQHVYVLNGMIDLCVTFPDFPSRAEVMAFFADFIEQQRRYMTLPDNAWEATWRYGVLRTVEDEAVVIKAVQNELPLTDAEVVGEVTLFRRLLPKQAASRLPHRQSQPSGT